MSAREKTLLWVCCWLFVWSLLILYGEYREGLGIAKAKAEKLEHDRALGLIPVTRRTK